MGKGLLILIEGTDELLPVARGIGARQIDGTGDMPQTFISCTGVGTKRSYECTKRQIENCEPGLIVSAGTFGALVDGIAQTSWMVNARSRMLGDVAEQRAPREDLDGAAASQAHIERLRAGLAEMNGKWVDGLLVCVGDVPLIDESEKARIAQDNNASGVDMETFGIAKAAAEAGIPWLTARVCVDTPAIPLPDFGALNPLTGRPYYGRLFKWIALHPVQCVPTLYGLWKLVNVYGRQLAELIRTGRLRP
jgi:nucleoside phosphorylase